MAAVVERAERRHVAGRTPAGSAGGSGTVSTLAAATLAYASRSHLSLGDCWARCARLRFVDENGYAVHRQLVAGIRLEDHTSNDSPRPYREGSPLDALGAYTRRGRRTSAADRRVTRRSFGIS